MVILQIESRRTDCEHVVVLEPGSQQQYTTCARCGGPLPFAFTGEMTVARIAELAEQSGARLHLFAASIPRPCFVCSGKGSVPLDGGGWRVCSECSGSGLIREKRERP